MKFKKETPYGLKNKAFTEIHGSEIDWGNILNGKYDCILIRHKDCVNCFSLVDKLKVFWIADNSKGGINFLMRLLKDQNLIEGN